MARGGGKKDRTAQAQRWLEADAAGESSPPGTAWARAVLAGERPEEVPEVAAELAQALAVALAERGDAETLTWLAARPSRPMSKAARAGIHRLRSKGIAVELPSAATAAHASPREALLEEAPRWHGAASPYDAHTQRLVLLAHPAAGGGLRVHEAHISARNGLLNLESVTTGRKEHRRLIEELRQRMGLVAVGRDGARWLLFDGARRRDAAGRPTLSAFVRARRDIGDDGAEHPHPALAIEAAMAEPGDLLDLFDDDELRGWYPPQEDLQQIALRQQEISQSALMVDESQRRTQAAHALQQSLVSFFDEPRCAETRQVLLDTAHLLTAKGKTARSALVRAAADVFVSSSDAIATHPFARHFIARFLELEVDPESRADPTGPTTTGGIIIP